MRLGDLDALKEIIETYRPILITSDYLQGKNNMVDYCITEIDNAPTVEPEELKRVRNICEHWNDKSSSFVSACNAFEDILHIFKMGVGDMGGEE